MKSTTAKPALDLNLVADAPPDLPAVVAPADAAPPTVAAPRTLPGELALTSEALANILAHRRSRNDGWTPIRIAAFIEQLAQTGSVTKAAAYADMSVAAAYHLRNHPEATGFRDAWDSAMAIRFEILTELAMERVTEGIEKIKWFGDEIVGRDRVFSDRLLIYMLNRSDPDRDRSLPLPGDPPLPTRAAPRPTNLPMAADFIVSAAVDTGKLGWEPDHDEQELDPELAADVAAMYAAQAERHAADAAKLAEERAVAAARADELRVERAAIAKLKQEEEEWEHEYQGLSRASKFSSSGMRLRIGGRSRRRT